MCLTYYNINYSQDTFIGELISHLIKICKKYSINSSYDLILQRLQKSVNQQTLQILLHFIDYTYC